MKSPAWPRGVERLREGVARIASSQQLGKTLSSTNPIESMVAICRTTRRNVKRWQNGDMCLRWTAAGMRGGAPVPQDHRLQARRRARDRKPTSPQGAP